MLSHLANYASSTEAPAEEDGPHRVRAAIVAIYDSRAAGCTPQDGFGQHDDMPDVDLPRILAVVHCVVHLYRVAI